MSDLIKRSLQIIGGGIKEATTDYTENLVSLKNDADTVRAGIMQVGKDGKETLQKMKSSNHLKRLTDWFYQRGNEYDSYDMSGSDDEFDAGFTVDSSDDPTSDTSESRILDADSMRDIVKGQLNAMYNIGGKQAEMGMANTAEIVSSVNSRAAEMVAAVNNVNSTLLSMSSKLDKLIELQSMNRGSGSSSSTNTQSNTIYDSNGRLSLSGIYNRASGNMKENASLVTSLFELASGATPEMLLGSLLQDTIGQKKFKVLGDRSIDEVGKTFNEAVGAGIHNALSEIIESKAFKNMFGDMTSTKSDRDYGKIQPERYTNKQATFDEMTRHSIISVIPEYLKKINENLSGERYEVDEKGKLTTDPKYKKTFGNAVGKVFEGSSGVSWDTKILLRDQAKAGDRDITASDISEASNVLTRVYVVYLHKAGKTNLRHSQLTADDVSVINMAVSMLTRATGKPDSFWVPVCMTVLQHLSTNTVAGVEFCANVNKRLQSMISAGEKWAKSNNNPNLDAGKITYDLISDQYVDSYNARNPKPKPDNSSNNKTEISRESKSSMGGQFTMLDYTRGIFNILNRGINVKVTNTVKTGSTRGHGYKRYILGSNQINNNDDMEVDISRGAQGDNDINVSDGDGKGYFNLMLDKMLPKGIRISMQRFAQMANNTKNNVFADVVETNSSGETVTRKQTIGEKVKQIMSPVTNKLKPVREGLGGIGKAIIGEKVTDDDGESHRSGGLIQRVGNKIHSGVNNIMDRVIEKQEYSQVQKEVKSMSSDDQDKIYAQQVLSLMQTAASDGETTEDVNGINEALNNIKDDKLRSKLQRSVTAMLRRSEKPAEKSGLGKILTSIIGKAFSGVKKIFSGILKIGGKLLGVVGKLAKAFFAIQKTGMSNIGRGLFGQKATYDEQGNQLRPETEGLLKKPIATLTKLAKSGLSAITSLTKSILNKVSDVMTSIGNKITGFFDKFKKDKTDKDSDKDKDSSLTNATRNLADTKLGFMQGLKDSLNESKEAAKKALMGKPQNYGEKKLGDIQEAMYGKKGVFKDIKEILDKILREVKTDSDDINIPGSTGNIGNAAASAAAGVSNATNAAAAVGNATTAVSSTAGGVAGAALGAAGGPVTAGAGYSMGQALGGALAAAPIVMAIVSALSAVFPGFNDLVETVKSIFFDALQPLNKVFTTLTEALKPVLEMVGEVITVIAESISGILQCVIGAIQPILEAIQPLLETIFNVLEPILELIEGLVEVILAPLMGVIEFVIVPIIRHVGNILEVLMGVVQVGIGIIISALGGLLMGIGSIVKFLTGKKTISETGKNMWDMGTNLVTSGIDGIKSGIQKEIQLVEEVVSGDIFKSDEEKDKEDKPKDDKEDKQPTGSFGIDGTISSNDSSQSIFYSTNNDTSMTGSGNTTINNYYGTYGSGNVDQHTFGSYMNMGERGCGPVALADAFARRTGSRVNPSQLASSMNKSGTYDPNRGTSVAGFMNTGRSMGMNLRAGGVTQQSLKRATPNNPITVIGSGGDFGTRPGNDHYMNVIGTDKHGGAYVANPLTGRVNRRPISSVAHSSKLGLYGSGDMDFSVGFGEEFSEAMSKLTDLSSNWLSAFTGPSKKDEMKDIKNAEAKKEADKQSKLQLGDLFDKFETSAFEAWKGEGNAKRDNESDEDLLRRFRNSSKYQEFMNNASITDENGETLSYTDAMNKTMNGIQGASNTLADEAYGEVGENGERSGGLGASLLKSANEIESQSSSNAYNEASGWGSFVSSNGVQLEGVNYTPKYKEANITNGANDNKTPLHEWFSKHANDDPTFSINGNWFYRRDNPDKYGIGSSDDYHKGVDINWNNDSLGNTPLYATTSGEVTASYYSNSGGNMFQWKDSAGIFHTYMHMKSPSPFNVGDRVVGGKDQVGIVGNTGNSSGDHLHYQITEKQWPSSVSDGRVYNPFSYFQYKEPTVAMSTGFTDDEKVYSYLVTSGMTPIGASGLMGCFKYESDMRGNNLENVYSDRWGLSDEEYTRRVDSGDESEEDFVYGRYATYMSHQTPGEAVGYGIGQQTSSALKQDMYDRTVKKGLSIATLGPQLDGVISVLKNRGVYDRINNAKTPTEANQWFLWRYEAGTGYNSDQQVVDAYSWMGWDGVNNRHKYAEQTYERFRNWSPNSQTSPTGTGSTSTGFGMVNSAWDAQIVENARQTGTTSGESNGIVNTKDTGLNMRSAPSISGSILATIPKGTELMFEASGTDGWLKVNYNGKTGYVSHDYVTLTDSYLDDMDLTAPPDPDTPVYGPQPFDPTKKPGSNFIGPVKPDSYNPTPTPQKTDSQPITTNGGSGIRTPSNSSNTTTTTTVATTVSSGGHGGGGHRRGSGDVSPMNDALYRSIMGSGDISSFTYDDIPPVDISEYVSSYNNAEGITPTIIVQRHEIKPDDTEKREYMRQILTNTYNVRAERVEELLEKILEKLDDGDKPSSGGNKPSNIGGTTPKLFDDDRIPAQVERLSIGQ